jgi:hypothetical protein
MVGSPMPGLEDFTDAELRNMPDVVVIYRRHIPWGDAGIIDEPVEFSRLRYVNFALPRLRADSRDLQAVSFIYHWIQAVPDEDLAAVRRRLDLETMVHLALRRLARDLSTRE